MTQTRQVFDFLIQGALRELISHDSLSFGPLTVEIKLVKPIKFTLLPHVNHMHSPSDHHWLFLPCLRAVYCEMKIRRVIK